MKYINWLPKHVRPHRWYLVSSYLILGLVSMLILGLLGPGTAYAQTPTAQSTPEATTQSTPGATAQDEILRVPSGEIRQLALSPDGRQVAAATSAGLWLYALNVTNSGKLLDPAPVAAVWWAPTGNLLATTSYTTTLQIWQVAQQGKGPTIQSESGAISAVAWAPDGTQLAVGTAEGAVELWQASDGALADSQKFHTAKVNSLVWSYNGTLLFSGAQDGVVHLWTLKTITSSDSLSQTEPLTPTEQATPTVQVTPTPVKATAQAIIQTDTLNIRSGPGTTYAKLGSAKLNDRLDVIGQVNACVWLQVQLPTGSLAWIAGSAQYVTLTTACDAIPQATPPAATPGATAAAGSLVPTATPAPPVSQTGTTTTTTAVNLPETQGCYRFQNQLSADLNVTITRADNNQNTNFTVASGQEYTTCLDPGSYTYTVDAPPPWASINGQLDVKAGDRFLIPVKAQ